MITSHSRRKAYRTPRQTRIRWPSARCGMRNNGGPIHLVGRSEGLYDGRRSDHEFFAAQHDDDEHLRAGCDSSPARIKVAGRSYAGTSQASPHIAGIATLAQQLAGQVLGRRLSMAEFESLLDSTGVTIFDGDDEDDNVTNTQQNYRRVDVLALGDAIWAMAAQGTDLAGTVV